MAHFEQFFYSQASIALPNGAETDVLGANGVDVSQCDDVTIMLKCLDASNNIPTVTAYLKVGTLWVKQSQNYGPVAANGGFVTIPISRRVGTAVTIGAAKWLRLTCTQGASSSSVQVEARGMRDE